MLLTIDVGNSRIKVAVFEYNKKIELFIFETKNALKNFENKGFPTKKEEAWKYTSLNAILKNDFSVFPNPASAQLNLNLKSIPGENTSISLCDAKGAFTTLISGNLTQKSYAFSLPQYLAKGMYTLTISSPKGQTSKKVLLN